MTGLHGRIRRFRRELFAATALYVVAFTVGFVAFLTARAQLDAVGVTPETVYSFEEFSYLSVTLNNLGSTLLTAAGGVALGVPTVLNTLFNGFLLGIVSAIAVAGERPVVGVVAIAPHTVIELPAFLLAASVGLKLPREFVRYLTRRQSHILTKQTGRDMLVLTAVTTVGIAVAGLVETFVTPTLVAAVGG